MQGYFFLIQHQSAIILGVIVAIVSWIDIKTLRIPIIMLIITPIFALTALNWPGAYFKAIERVASGLILFAALFGVNRAYFKLKGENGLGKHDPYYAAGLSVWLEPLYIPYAIIIACLATFALMSIYRIIILPIRKEVPFAPGLGIGFLVIFILLNR